PRRPSTSRSLTVLALLCLSIAISDRGTLKATNAVTLTPLAILTGNGPVGIDWLPGPNQLLISDHYDGGTGGNFAIVDKTTGAITTQLVTPAGMTNEIYFASVRPGSPSATAGWPVNHVFYAEGGLGNGPQFLGELNDNGAVVNAAFANFGAGETRVKRGGVEFDLAGVAGGDLIVVASRDDQDGPSTVYRVNR